MSQAVYSEGSVLPDALQAKRWRVLRGAETNTGDFGMAYIKDDPSLFADVIDIDSTVWGSARTL